MRYRIPLLAATLLMPLGASAQPLIQSQEGIALQNEILQLQQQVQQMQGQGGGNGGSSLGGAPPAASGGAGGNPLMANLLTQVQQLQAQVQQLNGQVSELQHQVDTQHDQTEKEISDLKFQMSNGGAAAPGAGAPPGAAAALNTPQASAPAAPPLAAPGAAVSNDPKAALQAALAAYAKHDYATARSLAQGIVTNNKAAPEAYRAQYLVAQSDAAQGNAQNAAVAFYGTYNMNKNGTYAPRALLGLASSLSAIHQNQEACETISSLNSQFTNLSAGMQAEVAAVAKRANCQ